jgi:hypothetical protein
LVRSVSCPERARRIDHGNKGSDGGSSSWDAEGLPALRTLAECAYGPFADSRRPVGVGSRDGQEHGVFRTAKCLRLEYGKLKELVQDTASVPRTTAPPAFVELMASQAVGLSECLIELEGPRGKMGI